MVIQIQDVLLSIVLHRLKQVAVSRTQVAVFRMVESLEAAVVAKISIDARR